MTTKHLLYYFVFFLVVASCSKKEKVNPLTAALKSDYPKIKRVMDSLSPYELQIRYIGIHKENGTTLLENTDFQVNDELYFYPASTIKLPVAVLALEKLNSIDSITRNSKFFVEGDTTITTFAKEIEKIFVLSDNEANNRLMEFLGQDYINGTLMSKGIEHVSITHRLATEHPDDITTKPLVIYLNDSTTINTPSLISTAPTPLKLQGTAKGIGHLDDDLLIQEPFDMSLKNYYSISAQSEVLKRIIFPEHFAPEQRFDITEEQRDFLLHEMQLLPKNAGYNPEEFYDSYGKFFMYGDTKDPIPGDISIYNKVGYAYGTLTDCAYIKDEKNDIEFMLIATILVNSNGIFNDNTYEFEEVGIPFLAELGRQVYQHELSNK